MPEPFARVGRTGVRLSCRAQLAILPRELKQENMNSKRIYIATFWRSNPQLKNGGYFTTKEFQSVSLQGATKQAERYAASNMYGGMAVKSVELKQENA